MAGKAVPAGAAVTKGVVRQAKNRNTKIIRTIGKRWSQAAETAFLEELAATANVRAAAAAAGFSTVAIYNRRKKWPGFAAEWDECLEQGYVRIETMLVELATDSLRAEAIRGDGPAPAMTVAEALNLLRVHRATVRGGAAQRYDARAMAPEVEAAKASLLRDRAGGCAEGRGGGGDRARGIGLMPINRGLSPKY